MFWSWNFLHSYICFLITGPDSIHRAFLSQDYIYIYIYIIYSGSNQNAWSTKCCIRNLKVLKSFQCSEFFLLKTKTNLKTISDNKWILFYFQVPGISNKDRKYSTRWVKEKKKNIQRVKGEIAIIKVAWMLPNWSKQLKRLFIGILGFNVNRTAFERTSTCCEMRV